MPRYALTIAHSRPSRERLLTHTLEVNADTPGAALNHVQDVPSVIGADDVRVARIELLEPDAPVIAPSRSPGACVYCGSSEISGGFVEIERNRALQRVTCDACDRAWTDVYTLSGVDLDAG